MKLLISHCLTFTSTLLIVGIGHRSHLFETGIQDTGLIYLRQGIGYRSHLFENGDFLLCTYLEFTGLKSRGHADL